MSDLDNSSRIELEREPWAILIANIGIKAVNEVLDARMERLFVALQELASITSRNSDLVNRLEAQREEWHPAKDQFERTVLHLAASHGNTKLVRCLVLAGAHINDKDGIYQTPLTLALHNNHMITSKFLVEIGSSVADDFFQNTASPLEVAKVKKMDPIVNMIERRRLDEKNVSRFLATHFQQIVGQGEVVNCSETDMDITETASTSDTV